MAIQVSEVERDGGKVKIKVTGPKATSIMAKKDKQKSKVISDLIGKDLAEIVEALAIKVGLADENGMLKG
jgi:hypothetical protein